LHEAGVLPPDTSFFDLPLSFRAFARRERCSVRDEWLRAAAQATRTSTLIFLDPDNGLEVSVHPYDLKGPKYVYYSDLELYVQRQQSLVIYQHIGRQGNASDQIRMRFEAIRTRFGKQHDLIAALYHRGTARAYICIGEKHHNLRERLYEILSGPWGAHFDLVDEEEYLTSASLSRRTASSRSVSLTML
jgi:hypothetical protein